MDSTAYAALLYLCPHAVGLTSTRKSLPRKIAHNNDNGLYQPGLHRTLKIVAVNEIFERPLHRPHSPG